MRIVSLFSGAGGLDLGLIQAGHDIIWANDIDKDAVATYTANIGGHIHMGDIQDVDMESLPDCDLIIGGFPCQGFSLANMRRTLDDERNQLYKSFHNAVKTKRPRFFVAENVKGILSLGKGEIVRRIRNDFEEAGYQISVNLVNMADYGVPQIRQRVIFLGQRMDVGKDLKIQLPSPTNSRDGVSLPGWISVSEAISRFPEPSEECGIPNHVCSSYKVVARNFTGHRVTDPDKPSPTILARGNGGGGVVAIPHYNGKRRYSIRESAAIQTFPDDFVFHGAMGSCYRQIGNAVPVRFAYLLGLQLGKIK